MSRFILIFALLGVSLYAYTKRGTVYTTDGSYADVKAAVKKSKSGDTVNLPAGTFSGWGVGGAILVNKAITIAGAGRTSTILAGTTGSPTIFNVSAGAAIRGFTFNGGGRGTIVFNVTGKAGTNIGARFTDLKLSFAGGLGSRMFYIDRVYFLADNCEFVGGAGNNEYIFMRGPPDDWDYPANPGTDQAAYFENCILAGKGYPDSNACGRIVFRFCIITAPSKIDAHGIASNSLPNRSSRLMEVYGCRWTWTSTSVGSMVAIEHRGGGGFFWDNITDGVSGIIGTYSFNEYGYTGQWPLWNRIYQTPFRYPLPDQIGAGPGTVVMNGRGTQVGGAEPVYFFANLKNGARATVNRPTPTNLTWIKTNAIGYAAGVTSITVTGASRTNQVGAGNYFSLPGDSTRYLITAGTFVSPGTITFAPALVNPIAASVTNIGFGPVATYQGLTGNPSATWAANDLVRADRDYFAEGATFNGTSGVGIGLRADMDAITINGITKTVGVGFWVTDEGTWNQSFTGTISAPAIEAGDYCEIVSVSDTNFIAIGARANAVGVRFVATGPGSGGGTVKPRQGQLYAWNGSGWNLKYTPYTYPHPLRAGDAPSSLRSPHSPQASR